MLHSNNDIYDTNGNVIRTLSDRPTDGTMYYARDSSNRGYLYIYVVNKEYNANQQANDDSLTGLLGFYSVPAVPPAYWNRTTTTAVEMWDGTGNSTTLPSFTYY